MRTSHEARDEGSTLIETLVSLAVIMVAMSAMGTFFVNSVLAVSAQRTSQTAAQLANSGIEQIRALKGSSLVTGRSAIRTAAQWDAAPAVVLPFLKNMQQYPDPQIVDPASTLGDSAAIPTSTQTMTLDHSTFDRTIYVGACDVYVSISSDCIIPQPSTDPQYGKYVGTAFELLYFRAVVLVTWNARTCPANCSYVASTLVSREAEPTFDFHRPAPQVTTTSAVFYRGAQTTIKLQASGGQLPNTWAAPASAVPAGMTLAADGTLSGTPTTVGPAGGVYTVTDQQSRSDPQRIDFTVVAPLTVTAPGNTVSHVGDVVTQSVPATGGYGTLKYTVTGLPPGLSLNPSTGAITGTPTTAGSYPVTVTVTDSNTTFPKPTSVPVTFTEVVSPSVTLTAINDQQVDLGSSLSVTAIGSGGDGKYTYTATGLPLGVTINATTGVVSGVPAGPGRYLPLVTVSDSTGDTASDRFVIEVDSPTALIFTSPSMDAPDQTSPMGKPVNLKLDDNSKALKLKPVTTVTGLPPGLAYDAQGGKISGQPSKAGTYVVTAVTTSLTPPQVGTLNFLWTVT